MISQGVSFNLPLSSWPVIKRYTILAYCSNLALISWDLSFFGLISNGLGADPVPRWFVYLLSVQVSFYARRHLIDR